MPRISPEGAFPARVSFGVRNHPLVRPMLVTFFISTVLIAIASLVWGGPVAVHSSLFALACCGIALTLHRRGYVAAAVFLCLACVLVVTVYCMWMGRGLHDVTVMILPSVILLGCMVLNRPLNLMLVGSAVGAVIVVALGEVFHLLPNDTDPLIRLIDAIISPIILTAVAVLVMGSMDRLLQTERGYREIFNATQEAILLHDVGTGAIVDGNETALAMYGYSRDELSSLPIERLIADTEANSVGDPRAMIQAAAANGPQSFESRVKRKDGTRFWVEINLNRSSIGGRGRVLAVIRDIDARKLTEAHTRQADKLRSLGQLVGGVAHDFNNQLAGIAGYAQLLTVNAQALPRVVADAKEILKATSRASKLTGQLLAFARRGQVRTELVDVNAVVANVVSLLGRSIDSGVTLRSRLCDGNTMVEIDPAQLHSAILNLGLNARDALASQGTVTFETAIIPGEARPEDRSVVVRVTDDGTGMDAVTRSRVFEPFFTTKSDGLGMGLALVYGMAKAAGGKVAVTSEPGQGSTFSVSLPLREAVPTLEGSGPAAAEARLGLRVLLAEDDAAVAHTTRALLEGLGCSVRHCVDGEQVVATFREAPGSFDVILLDLVMPRLSGTDAFVALRRIDPTARIVITSGCIMDQTAERLKSAGATEFLHKPYALEELARMLDRRG